MLYLLLNNKLLIRTQQPVYYYDKIVKYSPQNISKFLILPDASVTIIFLINLNVFGYFIKVLCQPAISEISQLRFKSWCFSRDSKLPDRIEVNHMKVIVVAFSTIIFE